jgi:gamma-glutamyltranspeptidase/glutathione hydrolase
MAFTTRPELIGTFGMVASTHWLASQTGMHFLERGGNAFDAAVGAAFVLHLAEPHLNGPGGDMPALIQLAGEDKPRVVCGQGVAPASASIEAYNALGLDRIPGDGMLATVVPGAVDGWLLMLRDHGTMRLEEILAPAIHYAEEGTPLVGLAVATIGQVEPLFRDHWKSSAALWLPGGSPPTAGGLYRNPAMAATWRTLLDAAKAKSDRAEQIEAARTAWAEGFVAEAVDQFCRTTEAMDSTGTPHKAFLSGADMAGWRASYDEPLSLDYKGHTIFKCGPWSQAPALLQTLTILDGFDLDSMDTLGPDFVHVVVEAMKLAYADREKFYGDPDFVDVPMTTLLSRDYAAQRRALIGPSADPDLRAGTVPGCNRPDPRILARMKLPTNASASLGEPTMAAERAGRGDTCHIDVVDRWGNMVAATPSGGWLQSSPTIPALGFCLNSRAQMFWLDPASPSALAPKRRPRTSLTPSFVHRGGKPYLAFGTPGGDSQDQWQLIFFLRHVHAGLNLQEAIDCPSFHTESILGSFHPRRVQPNRLDIEARFPAETLEELKRRGHALNVGGLWSEGRLSAVSKDGPLLKAGANPRGMQGYAVGR